MRRQGGCGTKTYIAKAQQAQRVVVVPRVLCRYFWMRKRECSTLVVEKGSGKPLAENVTRVQVGLSTITACVSQ
jgi:hypothetical protein